MNKYQLSTLKAIDLLITSNGYSPSIAEVSLKLDLTTAHGAATHINKLRAEGYLSAKVVKGRTVAHTIELTEMGRRAIRENISE